jgi:hypothetical protein
VASPIAQRTEALAAKLAPPLFGAGSDRGAINLWHPRRVTMGDG